MPVSEQKLSARLIVVFPFLFFFSGGGGWEGGCEHTYRRTYVRENGACSHVQMQSFNFFQLTEI